MNVERGHDLDLGDIWNFYVGKPPNNEYLLMLENLHYFSQNGVGLYIHQNQVIAAVAGRSVGLSEYKGDTLNYIKNIIGADKFQVLNSARIRKGGHTSTVNLIFDYLFDPNLVTSAHARNTYYSRAERKDNDGKKMWDAEFESTGSILTDYSKAKTGFAIYSENLPALPPPEDIIVEGKHKLSSVEEGHIPVTTGSNLQQGLQYSAVKMGYATQFSIQTLGSYGDGTMRITPKYWYVNPSKGVSTENISLYVNESGTYKEYYKASRQGTADTAKAYTPAANYILGHTLKDERAKVNAAEKQTPEYISATATNKVKLGTPSYIEIPTALRTYIGGTADRYDRRRKLTRRKYQQHRRKLP